MRNKNPENTEETIQMLKRFANIIMQSDVDQELDITKQKKLDEDMQ